jgi:hypothetical protein
MSFLQVHIAQHKAEISILIQALSILFTPIQPISKDISNISWRWNIIGKVNNTPYNTGKRASKKQVMNSFRCITKTTLCAPLPFTFY